MNNINRIRQELTAEAMRRAPELGISPAQFLELALGVVDLEDSHRLAQTNINQQVETMIRNVAELSEGS